MKKLILILSLLSIFYVGTGQVVQWPFPQLQAGVYVHDTLFFINEGGFGNCGQWAEFNICLNNDLIPVATGVNLELIIITLT